MGRTPQTKQAIVTLLSRHHGLSASSLLDQLLLENHRVNKTTVYRALEKLLSDGVVCRQIFTDDTIVYELRTDHHDHTVCEICGKIGAIPCVVPSPSSQQGMTITHHHLTLYGVCEECKHKTAL